MNAATRNSINLAGKILGLRFAAVGGAVHAFRAGDTGAAAQAAAVADAAAFQRLGCATLADGTWAVSAELPGAGELFGASDVIKILSDRIAADAFVVTSNATDTLPE